MKRLLVTRADEGVAEMAALTHPLLKHYAKVWGADFINLTHKTDCTVGDGFRHYRIMKLYDLLEDYDRAVCIDTDTIIHPRCPNLFDVVREDRIGTIYEDVGSRKSHRRKLIHQAQAKFGNVAWTQGYINNGVFVVSKMHRPIFQKINGEYWTEFGSDDVHLAWQAHAHAFLFQELPFTFNHMSMFSEEWHGSPSRFNSNIIHYAGGAKFPDNKGAKNTTHDKVAFMKKDMEKIWGSDSLLGKKLCPWLNSTTT